jgi:hypothetical protein
LRRTRGILANAFARCEIAPTRAQPTRKAQAVTLYAASRGTGCSSSATTTAQAQLSMPRSERDASHGQPSTENRPTLRQAPCVTAMPVSPGPRESRHSPRTVPIRSRTSRVDSSPGTRGRSGSPANHPAYASGKRSSNSGRVSPARMPRSNSRNRASRTAVRPVFCSIALAVSTARARSLVHSWVGA